MEKPASNTYPIHELLKRRWSPVAFADKPIPDDVLRRIFEAARWAASSYNEQPWRYIAAGKAADPETFRLLAGTLMEGNAWAKSAPFLALSIAKQHFTHSGDPNRVAQHDVGAASANLTLEALDNGLFVHQMAGFDPQKARDALNIPADFEPVAMLAMGYPGGEDQLNENLKKREFAPRTRKNLSEFVFRGKFDEKPL